MFASTNLVIELGVLILIFLGWQFLAAELVGGLLLIAVSSVVIKITYPKAWILEAREKVAEESDPEEDFDWRKRLASREGWYLVGSKFGDDWLVVWEEILIGFTVAGFVAVLFAGIMGFICSDLMAPPLVRVNATYYGYRVALYIAGVMYVSIVITALDRAAMGASRTGGQSGLTLA